MSVVSLNHVSKQINKTTIVNQLSCRFEENKIIGFLGKNGSGKTSIMKIISGEWKHSSGEVLIDGINPFNQKKVLEKICFIQEGDNFPPYFKIKEILSLSRDFYPNWNQALAENLISIFNLSLDQRLKELSKGMESAVGITVGIASRAPITIFDEPYIGMDANARKKFYKILLDDYMEHPRTIIFSTHLIDEVSMLFQEVYVISKGHLLLQEETEILKNHVFLVTGPASILTEWGESYKILDKKQFMGELSIVVYDKDHVVKGLPENCKRNELSLQDIIVYITEMEGLV